MQIKSTAAKLNGQHSDAVVQITSKVSKEANVAFVEKQYVQDKSGKCYELKIKIRHLWQQSCHGGMSIVSN